MPVNNKAKRKVTPEEIEELATAPIVEEPTPTPVEPEAPEPIKEPDEVEKPVETIVEPIEPPVEPIKEEEKPKETDYKEKFTESSREAMSLHFKNEKLNSLLSGDLEVEVPTEEELRKYAKENDADFDELDTFSKNILKKTLITEKKEAKRALAYEEIKKLDTWANKVEAFVVSEENVAKYPSLEGQEEDFKKFCMKDTQRGVDFNLLVASFLYESEQAPAPKKKGSLFLTRSNGRAEPPRPVGITASEAETIRLTDPKRYRVLIKTKKINIEV